MALSELQREANERKAALRLYRQNYLKPVNVALSKSMRSIASMLNRKKGLPGTADLKMLTDQASDTIRKADGVQKGIQMLIGAFAV